MKLYADTANLKEIEDVFNLGAIRELLLTLVLLQRNLKGL